MGDLTKIDEDIYKNYKLETYSEPSKPGCWNYSHGMLFHLNEDQSIKNGPFVHIKRNYHSFWHGFIEQDGKDYMLCGSDYQGFTLVCLDSERVINYLPKQAKHGVGWCTIRFISHDPVAKHLILEGCIWGGPFDRNTFDISNIDTFPWPLISSVDADEE